MKRTRRNDPAKPVVRPAQRRAFVLALVVQYRGVDVLNRWAVEDYCVQTNASYRGTAWGADICPMFGRDLAYLARLGKLKRQRCGLSDGAWQPGFPKWVWSYRLCNEKE